MPTARIEAPGQVSAGSFSPDGRRLAVVTNDLPYRFSPFSLSVCEFELPQGTLVQRCDYQGPLRHQCHDCMLHLGSTVMAVNGSG